MPILYETYARVPRVKKLRSRRVSSLQEVEADHFRVVEEYAVSSIYMTPDDLKNHIKAALKEACAKKDAILEYFTVLKTWAIWKIYYTEYHIEYEAYMTGKPHSPAIITATTVTLILLLALGIVIVFAIWLVVTKVIEPIWGVIPPSAKPWLATALVIGASLVAVGAGVYIIKSVIPRFKK